MNTSDPEDYELYRRRQAGAGSDPSCDPPELALTPDVDPAPPEVPCDDPPQKPKEEFVAPPPEPPAPPANNSLPGPLIVYSRTIVLECQEEGQVNLLAEDRADPGHIPIVTTEAQHDIQLVYLDDIDVITQSELFRLSSAVSQIQTYLEEHLLGAIDSEDYAAFDAGLAALVRVSAPVAERIRMELVLAQNLADSIATSYTQAKLSCGWLSRELWVTCNLDSELGYDVTYSDPGGEPGEVGHVPAGIAESLLSQAGPENFDVSADGLAARQAAFELNCLYGNAWVMRTCADTDTGIDAITETEWPLTWAYTATEPDELTVDPMPVNPPVMPAAGGVPGNPWQDWETNIDPRTVSSLNGQQFVTRETAATGEYRTLRYYSVIEADDPRAYARTQEEADDIAANLALQGLDCFVPSRPRMLSCVTPGLEAANDDVRTRLTAMGWGDTEAGRTTAYEELYGGDPDTPDDGPDYARYNEGYDAGDLDESAAFEVHLPPGFFAGATAAEADEVAENYGSGFLQCVWLSPRHECVCVGEPEHADGLADGSISAKWSRDLVDANGANFRRDLSSPIPEEDVDASPGDASTWEPSNILPRGQFISDEYPNKTEDPEMDDAYAWDGLSVICQSTLNCVFDACRVAYCEPKGDDRPFKANGMPNFATWGTGWVGRPAHRLDQEAFMTAWYGSLASALAEEFTGDYGPPCLNYDYDGCDAVNNDQTGEPDGDFIVNPGPVSEGTPGYYGTPARFKYGGILRRGKKWGEPGNTGSAYLGDGEDGLPLDPADDPENPEDIGEASLYNAGRVKQCSHVNLPEDPLGELDGDLDNDPPENITPWQAPNPWGHYSGAEGYFRANSPIQVAEMAAADAVSRLDCTHVSWPRHMHSCGQPNQRPFGRVSRLNIAFEGSSTREANEQAETMLLQMMGCQDPGGGAVAVDGSKIAMLNPSMAKVGEDDCLEKGLHEVQFYEPDCTLAEDNDLPLTVSSHIFVSVICCEDEADPGVFVKRLRRHVVPDATAIANEINSADYKKERWRLGLECGVQAMNTLRVADGAQEVWYISSVYVRDLGTKNVNNQRMVVQAHMGPIVVQNGCCYGSPFSSSSSSSSSGSSGPSGSSAGGSGGGGGSGGSDGSGGSSGGSGSGKTSNAIVPDPLGVWEQDYMAYFVMEARDVRFEETIVDIPAHGAVTEVPINKRYALAVSAGTMRVLSATDRQGRHVRATLSRGSDMVILHRPWWQRLLTPSAKVTVRLTGIRMGYLGVENPWRSREQFLENEAFLNSAYSDYQSTGQRRQ